jgi:phosphoserine aminotransferase
MEMTHRGAEFGEIFAGTKERFKRALSIPDTHEVLFMQGGATAQFASVPMNLMGENGVVAIMPSTGISPAPRQRKRKNTAAFISPRLGG